MTISELLSHDDSCPDQSNPMRENCIHDDLDFVLRNLLIFDEDETLPTQDSSLLDLMFEPNMTLLPRVRKLRDDVQAIHDNEYRRDELSLLRYTRSLCPLHGCDYAICFDDNDPECAVLRNIFPNHDT